MEEDMLSMIKEFLTMYNTLNKHSHIVDTSLVIEGKLHTLTKEIVERLSPQILQDIGYELTNVLKIAQEKTSQEGQSLLKIATLYEELEDNYHALKTYRLSGDEKSILGFIGKLIQTPKTLHQGVSALKDIPKDKRSNMLEKAYGIAFDAGKYDLAMDVAYLLEDKTKERKVLDATGLKDAPTIL